jgi:hypothetical protein
MDTFSLDGSFGAAIPAEGLSPDYGLALPGDAIDTLHVAPYAPQAAGMKWWESITAYGLGRYIDNRWGPTNTAGNTNPGTFGGTNGKTYANTPTGQAGVLNVAGMAVPSWMLLAGVALLGVWAVSQARD